MKLRYWASLTSETGVGRSLLRVFLPLLRLSCEGFSALSAEIALSDIIGSTNTKAPIFVTGALTIFGT
jgi:hypothetical protein